ncbi:type VII secretion integral membrane protein EccD [Streptomyces sp. MUSC 14]|uniref:type VII secretion integral membrane protein EccD n=1 Tax=Streptomyces sp. MUSC 14 TaxID=1354889 RepID=UPI0009A11C8C|nr:type VII secretion integral membrane protein EccD [Streptomyces sp. MUSC 14]
MISRGTVSRTALSRVTLVGERRRVDLVLPAREPVGLLLPEVLRLLDDRVAEQPQARHLVTADGSALELDATLESAGVPDGAVLRLVRVEDAPSAPVVHDVSDEAAGDLDVRAWRWDARARRITASGAGVVWASAVGFMARQGFEAKAAGWALLVTAAVAAAAGALLGRAGHKGLAAALVVVSAVVGVQGVWSVADAQSWPGAVRLAAVLSVLVVALLLLGWFSPCGRGALVGAGALTGAGACWEVALAFQSGGVGTTGSARAGAVLAVVSVVALGVLPRWALAASGLSGLDDRRSAGVSVSRYQVATALAATHWGLVLATVVIAVCGAVAGVLAVRTVTVWTVLLAVAVAFVLALRARAYPLVAEVVVLLAASMVVALRLAWLWREHSGAAAPLAVLGVLVVLSLSVLAVQPAEHVRVRLRKAGDVLESVGVVALFPLVLGVFGVYGRLLGTFA